MVIKVVEKKATEKIKISNSKKGINLGYGIAIGAGIAGLVGITSYLLIKKRKPSQTKY